MYAYHICRLWYIGSYTIKAKPMKSLELHYPMIQFFIKYDIIYSSQELFYAVYLSHQFKRKANEVSQEIIKASLLEWGFLQINMPKIIGWGFVKMSNLHLSPRGDGGKVSGDNSIKTPATQLLSEPSVRCSITSQ